MMSKKKDKRLCDIEEHVRRVGQAMAGCGNLYRMGDKGEMVVKTQITIQTDAGIKTFGDVKYGDLFVDLEGVLCVKTSAETYTTLADSAGDSYVNSSIKTGASMVVNRIIGNAKWSF